METKPNTLKITNKDIALITPKGERHGGTFDGKTLWFGRTPIRFNAEITAEIATAIATYRTATYTEEILDADLAALEKRYGTAERAWNAENEVAWGTLSHAEATGKIGSRMVRTDDGTGPIVVRFAKADMI